MFKLTKFLVCGEAIYNLFFQKVNCLSSEDSPADFSSAGEWCSAAT
jgi:hypothetical protein